MEEFRRQFLIEAVERLENALADFQRTEHFSDSQKAAFFRTLHTVKGTAQTFGLPTPSQLAHQLENLLAELNTETNFANAKNLLAEGIEFLIESLRRKDFALPASFARKIGVIALSVAPTPPANEDLPIEISDFDTAQLSVREKNAVRAALENGKNLYCLEVGYELQTFAEQLIAFRETLESAGEIIAVLPSARHNAAGKIGFQILLASAVNASEIAEIAEVNAAQIVFDSSRRRFPEGAPNVLAQCVEYGEKLARELGKQIEFQTSGEKIRLAPGQSKLIFEVLLHLVRNAIDHAFENRGAVKINLRIENERLHLTFSDDGRGINASEIRSRAVEKKLLAADELLSERAAFDLIFTPEFSTKTVVTEISGRGVGLDAVKHTVEKNGGAVTVKSSPGKGTIFEIYLPAAAAERV